MRGPYSYTIDKLFQQDVRDAINKIESVDEAKKMRTMLRFGEVVFGSMGIAAARSGPIAEVVNDSESMTSKVLETTLDVIVAAPTIAATGVAAVAVVEAHLLARRTSHKINELNTE